MLSFCCSAVRNEGIPSLRIARVVAWVIFIWTLYTFHYRRISAPPISIKSTMPIVPVWVIIELIPGGGMVGVGVGIGVDTITMGVGVGVVVITTGVGVGV